MVQSTPQGAKGLPISPCKGSKQANNPNWITITPQSSHGLKSALMDTQRSVISPLAITNARNSPHSLKVAQISPLAITNARNLPLSLKVAQISPLQLTNAQMCHIHSQELKSALLRVANSLINSKMLPKHSKHSHKIAIASNAIHNAPKCTISPNGLPMCNSKHKLNERACNQP
jgi:hypothetical protein